jgi:hypothetical protein
MQIVPKSKIAFFFKLKHVSRWAVRNSVIQTNAQSNAQPEYLGASVQIVLHATEGVIRLTFTQNGSIGIAPKRATRNMMDAEYAGG